MFGRCGWRLLKVAPHMWVPQPLLDMPGRSGLAPVSTAGDELCFMHNTQNSVVLMFANGLRILPECCPGSDVLSMLIEVWEGTCTVSLLCTVEGQQRLDGK